MNSKRGLSTVVVTLIMILLVIVAAGIVWVVISNVIETGSEQVSSGFGNLLLDLKVEKVLVEDNGDVKVTVNRGAGKGDISGLNLIVSDGDNSVLIKEASISELGQKTFTIASTELTDVGFVKSVSVAPTFKDSSGKETVGGVVDVFEKNSIGLGDLSSYGLVSWYRFEGNVNDVVGNNDGFLRGGMGFLNGDHGQAGNFDGVDDSVEISDNSNLQLGKDQTIIAWFKPSADISDWARIVGKGGSIYRNYGLWRQDDGDILWQIYSADGSGVCQNNQGPGDSLNAPVGKLIQLVGTYDGTDMRIYIDGNLEKTCPYSGTPYISNAPLTIGHSLSYHSPFVGQIDEVMIFDNALTEEEIRKIYELEL